ADACCHGLALAVEPRAGRSVPAPPADFHAVGWVERNPSFCPPARWWVSLFAQPTLRASIDAEPLEIDLRPAAGADIRHHPPAAAGLGPAVRALAHIDEQVGDAGAPEIGRAIRGHGAQACPRAHRAMLRHLRE